MTIDTAKRGRHVYRGSDDLVIALYLNGRTQLWIADYLCLPIERVRRTIDHAMKRGDIPYANGARTVAARLSVDDARKLRREARLSDKTPGELAAEILTQHINAH